MSDTYPPDATRLGRADVLADLLNESLVNEIYMFVFHRRRASAADIVQAGFEADMVKPVLNVLASRGLISREGDAEWVVVPPSRSFPPLAARLEERARLLRTSLPGLASAYRSSGHESEVLEARGIEFLPTAEDVVFAITQCYAQSQTGVKIMRRDSIASRRAVFESMPSLLQGRVGLAERAIECTTVLHTALINDLGPADLDLFNETGHEQLLLSGQVPMTVVVGDEGTAVVEIAKAGHTEGLLITHPDLVEALSEVVDVVIAGATAWQRDGITNPAPHELGPSEQEVLHLLGLGVPDATIARRMGISSRTFDRRVRVILDKLGAATRFQAGVIASRRGWL